MNKLWKKISLVLMSVLSVVCAVVPTTVFADADEDILVVAPTIDNSNGQLGLTITNVARAKEVYNPGEDDEKIANIKGRAVGAAESAPLTPLVYADATTKNFNVDADDQAEWKDFSYIAFPGYNQHGNALGSTSDDSDQAASVVSTIGTSFNMLLEYIKNITTKDFEDRSVFELAKFFDKIGKGGNTIYIGLPKDAADDATSDTYMNIQYGGVTAAQFEAAGSTMDPELNGNYYAYIEFFGPDLPEGTPPKIVLQYKMPKGYAAGQKYSEQWKDRTANDSSEIDYPQIDISWQGLIRFAANAATRGANTAIANETFNSSGDDNIDSLSNWFGNLIEKLFASLGLYSTAELMTNGGTRGAAYYMGVYPYSWQKGFNVVYWAAQVVAFFILLVGILKLLIRRNMAALGLGDMKNTVDLRAGILSYAETILMMMLFPVFFTAMLQLNELIVDAFGDLSSGSSITAGGFFSNILYAIAYLCVMIKLNVEYLVRAITVGTCYMISPITVSSIALDPGRKMYFNKQLREMFGNIFVQAFDAICYTVIAALAVGTSKAIERIILIYAFIPLNRWFKNNVAGLEGTGGDRIVDQADRARSNFMGAAFGNAGMALAHGVATGAQRATDNAAKKTAEAERDLNASIQQAKDGAQNGNTKVRSMEELSGQGAESKGFDKNLAVQDIQEKQKAYQDALAKQKRTETIAGGAQFLTGLAALGGGMLAAGDGQNTSAWFDMATGGGIVNGISNLRHGIGENSVSNLSANRVNGMADNAINNLQNGTWSSKGGNNNSDWMEEQAQNDFGVDGFSYDSAGNMYGYWDTTDMSPIQREMMENYARENNLDFQTSADATHSQFAMPISKNDMRNEDFRMHMGNMGEIAKNGENAEIKYHTPIAKSDVRGNMFKNTMHDVAGTSDVVKSNGRYLGVFEPPARPAPGTADIMVGSPPTGGSGSIGPDNPPPPPPGGESAIPMMDNSTMEVVHKRLSEAGIISEYNADKGTVMFDANPSDLQNSRTVAVFDDVKNMMENGGQTVIFRDDKGSTVTRTITNAEYAKPDFNRQEWIQQNKPGENYKILSHSDNIDTYRQRNIHTEEVIHKTAPVEQPAPQSQPRNDTPRSTPGDYYANNEFNRNNHNNHNNNNRNNNGNNNHPKGGNGNSKPKK